MPAPRLSVLTRRRLADRVRELGAFGTVGMLGYVTDVGVFNLLRYAGEDPLLADKPLTAKILSVTVATAVTYLGNRHWTWRDRPRRALHHEIALFVAMNVAGMLIAVGCLAVSHYVLGLDSALADNISANVVGLVLGTAFRFWAYRTFVFPEAPVDLPGAAADDGPAPQEPRT